MLIDVRNYLKDLMSGTDMVPSQITLGLEKARFA
jgi:hypothetical protein